MNVEPKRTRGLLIGAFIGALIGAGAAYLLLTAPADEESPEPVTAKELLGLTGLAAALIRKLDDIRRRT